MPDTMEMYDESAVSNLISDINELRAAIQRQKSQWEMEAKKYTDEIKSARKVVEAATLLNEGGHDCACDLCDECHQLNDDLTDIIEEYDKERGE